MAACDLCNRGGSDLIHMDCGHDMHMECLIAVRNPERCSICLRRVSDELNISIALARNDSHQLIRCYALMDHEHKLLGAHLARREKLDSVTAQFALVCLHAAGIKLPTSDTAAFIKSLDGHFDAQLHEKLLSQSSKFNKYADPFLRSQAAKIAAFDINIGKNYLAPLSVDYKCTHPRIDAIIQIIVNNWKQSHDNFDDLAKAARPCIRDKVFGEATYQLMLAYYERQETERAQHLFDSLDTLDPRSPDVARFWNNAKFYQHLLADIPSMITSNWNKDTLRLAYKHYSHLHIDPYGINTFAFNIASRMPAKNICKVHMAINSPLQHDFRVLYANATLTEAVDNFTAAAANPDPYELLDIMLVVQDTALFNSDLIPQYAREALITVTDIFYECIIMHLPDSPESIEICRRAQLFDRLAQRVAPVLARLLLP